MLGPYVSGPHEPSIVIVEDDPDLQALLVQSLALQGFRVEAAGSALELYRILGQRKVDAVIVDLGLPDLDGMEIARFLRQQTAIGIIAITANTAPDTRLRFFENGADLFFAKPIDCRELAVAARGLIQRLRATSTPAHPDAGVTAIPAPAPVPVPESRGPHWLVDNGGWTISAPGGQPMHLSAKEMRLVTILCRSPGEPVIREVLHDALGYANNLDGDRALEALVRRLRSKLKLVGDDTTPIQTVHGAGYLFSAPVVIR